jgi:hypothetical protein
MSDLVLVEGDMVNFLPNFGPAIVVVRPGKLAAGGGATIGGKAVCVDGDEGRVSVAGCMYMTPQYSIPGTGTLKIEALGAAQRTKTDKTGGKAMLLKGSSFTASFEVQTPAQQPPPGPSPPIPDATPKYTGSGMFLATNATVRAS